MSLSDFLRRHCHRRLPVTARLPRTAVGAALVLWLLLSFAARAQIDEIQVYTGDINKPGEFSITLHDNYTAIGPKRPAFIGGIVPDHSLNGVPEYALGMTPWFELGAHLPVYTVTRDGRMLVDGGKLRALFVLPNAAERTFWYGTAGEGGPSPRDGWVRVTPSRRALPLLTPDRA